MNPCLQTIRTVSGDVAAGGTVTTDPGTGATPDDPVQASVTTPVGSSIIIALSDIAATPPLGYVFVGRQVNIGVDPATPESPLVIVLTLDASIVPSGANQNTLPIFKNGVQVPSCGANSGIASPDPCVSQHVLLGDGADQVTILSSTASAVNVARVCPSQTITPLPDSAQCGQIYGAIMKVCYKDTGGLHPWWVKEAVNVQLGEDNPSCCLGCTVLKATDPMPLGPDGCVTDTIAALNGPPGAGPSSTPPAPAPCTSTNHQTISIGPDKRTVETCGYGNTIQLRVTRDQQYAGTVTTTDTPELPNVGTPQSLACEWPETNCGSMSDCTNRGFASPACCSGTCVDTRGTGGMCMTPTTTTTTMPVCVTTSGCFCDTGDGTIHDTCTGLQWEKKTTTVGLQNVNNRYSWAGYCSPSILLCQPNAPAGATCAAEADGGPRGCSTCASGTCDVDPGGFRGAITTAWDWINQINATSFAGHSDWRLPSEVLYNNYPACCVDGNCAAFPPTDCMGMTPSGAKELDTILLAPHPCGSPCIDPVFGCAKSPCIDPVFGPTATGCYWSSTTIADSAYDTWFVSFGDGTVSPAGAIFSCFVRAVRGGS